MNSTFISFYAFSIILLIGVVNAEAVALMQEAPGSSIGTFFAHLTGFCAGGRKPETKTYSWNSEQSGN